MMPRLKHMLGLYQYVIAAACSVVVGSADMSLQSRHDKRNMCVDPSLVQRVEQCRMDGQMSEGKGKERTKEEREKQQYSVLQRMLASDKMIVDAAVLEAVVQVESRGKVEIGSQGNGCGVMQLTKPAIAGGLARLYSPTARHDTFREKYAGAIAGKKQVIDAVTDNYFAFLEDGARKAEERVLGIREEYALLTRQQALFKEDVEIEREVGLRRRELRRERNVLGQFVAAVKHGYLLYNPKAQQVYAQARAELQKESKADKYISWATGMDRSWVGEVAQQRQMIEQVRQTTCDVANPELNVVFGDLTLVLEGEHFNTRGKCKDKKKSCQGGLAQALYSYNQGRTDYLTKGAWLKGEYYRRFKVAYDRLFDEKPPTVVPLRESRLMM